MGEVDDLLREASDPTTPGERLRELSLYMPNVRTVPAEMVVAQAAAVQEAALANPSLPLNTMRLAMLASAPPVWRNPAIPLLLKSESRPEFREAARRALSRLSPQRGPDGSLESLVEGWSPRGASSWAERPTTAQAIALARRLAVLFSLPWPEEPVGPSSPTDE